MIHQSFIKSAQAYKIKEQRLFKKMEDRLDEELLRTKLSMKGIQEERPGGISEEMSSPKAS